ncbi:MAG: hypothetical protein ACP5I7_03550 [Sulfolobales archaeon]
MSSEYIASLSFSDTKTLLALVDVLSSLVDDILIDISSEGDLKIVAVDPAKVALIEVEMPHESFLEYSIKKSISLGISTKNLSMAMTDVKRTNKVSLRGDEENVVIVIEGIPNRTFVFRNLEIPREEIPKIDIEFPAKASVLPDPFATAISDLSAIANYINFRLTQDVLELKDSDTQKRVIRLSKENNSLLDASVEGEVSSDYDASYLAPLSKLIKLSSALDIYLGSGIPLKIDLGLSAGGRVVYYLAPRA